jgi:hypothetical protein
MLQEIKTDYVLFLDVETVPQYPAYSMLPESKKKFWDQKASFLAKSESDTPESLYERAGIYAEFGKIVCISSGFIRDQKLHIKSFAGDDEKQLLLDFRDVLQKIQAGGAKWFLCAHNGKEFDFPYIARRMVIHGIPVPGILDPRGKWAKDLQLIDTMELWKFGDYKNFTSLDLLADILGIPSPKDDMDGSQVCQVYYNEQDLTRIVTYCEKDVKTLCRVFLKFKGEAMSI